MANELVVVLTGNRRIDFSMNGCDIYYMKELMEWTVAEFNCSGGRGMGKGRGKRLFIRSLKWIKDNIDRRSQPLRIRLMPVAGHSGDQRALNRYYEKMGFHWENEADKSWMFAMFYDLLRDNVQQVQAN